MTLLKRAGESLSMRRETNHLETEETNFRLAISHLHGLIKNRPRIMYLPRMSKLKVRFYLTNGQRKSKLFPCSDEGSEDKTALRQIKSFVESKQCREWLADRSSLNPTRKVRAGKWNHIGQVSAGIDARRYVDNIKFNLFQSVHYNNNKVVFANNQPNQTKRLSIDQKIIPLDSVKDSNKDSSICTWLLRCASQSSVCRTDCGELSNNMNLTDDRCPFCNFDLSNDHSCWNCKGNHLGTPKPPCMSPNKFCHTHFNCKWKIKLVMTHADLTKWDIYESIDNKNYHRSDPIENKRKLPALSTHDHWDHTYCITSNKSTPAPLQIFTADQTNNSATINGSLQLQDGSNKSTSAILQILTADQRNDSATINGNLQLEHDSNKSTSTILQILTADQRNNAAMINDSFQVQDNLTNLLQILTSDQRNDSALINTNLQLQNDSNKSTPTRLQILTADQRNDSATINDNLQLQHVSIKQEEYCVSGFDKQQVKRANRIPDEIGIFSDWRDTEKLLENSYSKVLLFHRGFSNSDRDYHIVVSGEDDQLCDYLRGFAIKKDLMAVRCSLTESGCVGSAVAVCNTGNKQSQLLTIQLIAANTPCSYQTCDHPRQLHIFNDGHGFFQSRTCSDHSADKKYVWKMSTGPNVLPQMTESQLTISYSDKIGHLKVISHVASDSEMAVARQGKILELLHRVSGDMEPLYDIERSKVLDPYCPRIELAQKVEQGTFEGKRLVGILKSSSHHELVKGVPAGEVTMCKKEKDEEEQINDDRNHCLYDMMQYDQSDSKADFTGSPSPIKKARINIGENSAELLPRNSIVCGMCIELDNKNPFWCMTEGEYCKHMVLTHNLMQCGSCYQAGMKSYFSNIEELRQHQSQHHQFN